MNKNMDTIKKEDSYIIPFFNMRKLSIERGNGVYVWDENGLKFLDFTGGWGVTCIGHANPVITEALITQSKKIIQNPDSGLTYSPVRAELLELISKLLPSGLKRIFFSNSGAEANDAAIKLARKASGKLNVISAFNSFHGRTISTASATGQAKHRDKYKPLMPNYIFVPYNDIEAMEKAVSTDDVAAVILEPIQGEGGVIVPSPDYLKEVSSLCRKYGVYLIVDEIQTGFCRTGKMFASDEEGIKIDFLTMAKGIAGGFPFGAFAVTEEVSSKLGKKDHGGTYCGNPLGCAVSYAVINYLIDKNIKLNVKSVGNYTMERIKKWKDKYPELIQDLRGQGLLIAIEFHNAQLVGKIAEQCVNEGLLVNLVQEKIIRLCPALNITQAEMEEGLSILDGAIETVLRG